MKKVNSIEVDRQALIKEINIILRMNHRGVIKMHGVYENNTYLFIINELLKGGERWKNKKIWVYLMNLKLQNWWQNFLIQLT